MTNKIKMTNNHDNFNPKLCDPMERSFLKPRQKTYATSSQVIMHSKYALCVVPFEKYLNNDLRGPFYDGKKLLLLFNEEVMDNNFEMDH